ncbi:MFS transporter [Nocardia aurantiaca]|uniref:MFS transporter n=1 Tax=Nocardia aurantiaca TaxID=2675850 RepID=A0A6I3KXY4_9NOCA|nr:MFS transporter [Nocardia aurantiaca]MTE15683.1 MFS transporter [Nocardia aurantiaca]
MSSGTTTPERLTTPAERTAWRRLVVVFALTQTVGYGAMIQAFTALLSPMAESLVASRTEIAAAATISTLVGALAAVPVGQLLDRYGGRALMTTGSAIGALAVVLWSQAHTLAQLYLAFVLIGLALAMSTYEAAFAVLVATSDAHRRDGAIVTVTMICGLATSFYYLLAGRLEMRLGWRTTLVVLAAVLVCTAVPLHLWAVPGRSAHMQRITRHTGVPVGGALRDRRFWLLVVAFVAQSGSTSAFLLLMVSYFRDIGHSAATASALPITVGAAQIGSRLALAPLARRFGMVTVTAVSFAVQGLGLALLPLAGTALPFTMACVVAFGLGYGTSVVARPSIVADAFGVARFASIIAVMTVPIALSRASAPLAAAWLGDWRFLVVMGAAALVAALALLMSVSTNG